MSVGIFCASGRNVSIHSITGTVHWRQAGWGVWGCAVHAGSSLPPHEVRREECPPSRRANKKRKKFLRCVSPKPQRARVLLASFACKRFVSVPAASMTHVSSTLSNVVVHRIPSERVCIRCFNPFLLGSSLAASRRSLAVLPSPSALVSTNRAAWRRQGLSGARPLACEAGRALLAVAFKSRF